MSTNKLIQTAVGPMLLAAFLAGCATPTTASTPTLPPLPPPNTLPPQPQPGALLPPAQMPGQPLQPEGSSPILRFVRTVEVSPNAVFRNGAFARVNYVPATDHLVVTFAGRLVQPTGECQGGGHGYVEFTLDLEPTGESGVLNCEVADMAGVMVGNTYYDVSMHAQEGGVGWRIMQFDAVTWERQADIFFPLQTPQEKDADPMAAYVNGRLDVSSYYSESGEWEPIAEESGTHHQFFSDDLTFLEERILTDIPHTNGSSLIYVDGVYYFISATAFSGGLIVMTYDEDWNYLGARELINQAHFPTGVVFDGNRFYVAYTDTSQRTEPGFFPVYLNVHLAAFDRQWSLLEDIAVTDSPASDEQMFTRASVILHGNRLYVSYDLEGSTGEEVAGFIPGRAFVSVYELAQGAP